MTHQRPIPFILMPFFIRLLAKVLLLSAFITCNLYAAAQTQRSFDSALNAAIRNNRSDEAVKEALLRLRISSPQLSAIQKIELEKKLLDYYTRLNNDTGMMESYRNTGTAYATIDAFDKALYYYLEALKVAKHIPAYVQQTDVNIDIAYLYTRMAEAAGSDSVNLQKALLYQQQANDIVIQQQLKGSEMRLFGILAVIYDLRGEHNKAQSLFRKMIAHYEAENNQESLAYIFSNLAISLKKNKEYEAALSVNKRALHISDSMNMGRSRIFIMNNMANLYYEMGQLVQSKTLALQTIEAATTTGINPVRLDMLQLLTNLYEKEDQPAIALKYNRSLTLLKDSILGNKTIEQMGNIRAKYDIDLKDEQIASQHQIITLSKRQNLLLWCGIFLAVGIGTIIYMNQRRTKRLLHKISTQQQELEQLNQIKDRLFSVVSHDLRMPVNNLLSFVFLMDMDITAEKRKIYQQELKQMLVHTTELMENLLHFARTQMKQQVPRLEHLFVFEVFDNILPLLAPSIASKKIHLINYLPKDATVLADRQMLALILRNLLSNAIKFSPNGGTITLTATHENGMLFCAITDEGPGIPAGLVEALAGNDMLQPVASLPGTDKELGTGLGLVLCRTFIQQMNGTIQPEQGRLKGSSIIIKLPA